MWTGGWEADVSDLVKTDVPLTSSLEELLAFLNFRDVLEDGKELVIDLLHRTSLQAGLHLALNLGRGNWQLLAPSAWMIHV